MNRFMTMAGLALALFSATAGAATLEEDEARIEALIRAERVVARSASRPAVTVATVTAPSADGRDETGATVPVVASVMAPAVGPNDDWLATPENEHGLPLAELPRYVGRRIAITTSGDRVHRGVLGSADGKQVTVRVKKPGGSATYTLTSNQIVRVDLR